MKKFLFFLSCITVVCINIKAQQKPFLQWQKAYGGTRIDGANSIQQTNDGGYIIAGSSQSNNRDVTGNHGGFDYWIVKTDATGSIVWEKSYGGSSDDFARSIQQTTDGGYIVAGESYSNDGDVTGHHGSADYWIVKINAVGNIQWEKSYGGSSEDLAKSIQQTTDGGYIVAGSTISNNGDVSGNHGNDDYWIVKLDPNGSLKWQRALGGSNYEQANSIQQSSDGGYIVAGSTISNNGDVSGNHGSDDYWIVKLNAVGNVQWQKTVGGSSQDVAQSIQQTTDRGYIIAGYTYSHNGDVTGNHGSSDYWVVKTDSIGNLQWEKTYGGTDNDYAYSIQQTLDGGYIVTGINGNLTSSHLYADYWVVKLSTVGKIQWQKSLGGSGYDQSFAVLQTNDKGYVLAGDTESNNGDVTGNHGNWDFWIVKLSPETLNDNIHINAYQTSKSCSYGNSISCTLKDTVKKYTVRFYRFGVLYDSALNVTGHIGFHNLPPGAYYATANDNKGVISYSSEVGVVPASYNLNTTNITSFSAQLNWSGFDCVDNYTLQFRIQGQSKWENIITRDTVSSYVLYSLRPSTTYVWRVASQKRKNGITATGKFSDSAIFITASAIAATNQSNITRDTNKNVPFNVSPNPAKNYFVINFKDDNQQKLNAILYDVNGKTIWISGLINASALNGKQVNTSQFAKGVFYLKLINENGELIASAKIVVAN